MTNLTIHSNYNTTMFQKTANEPYQSHQKMHHQQQNQQQHQHQQMKRPNNEQQHNTASDDNRRRRNNPIQTSILAGYAAGTCGILVGYPLDSIKVLIQTNTPTRFSLFASKSSSSLTPSTTLTPNKVVATVAATRSVTTTAATSATNITNATLNAGATTTNLANAVATQQAVQVRSPLSLYSGASLPLVTAGITQAAYFALYGSFRRTLHERRYCQEQQSQPHYYQDGKISNHNHEKVNLYDVTAAAFVSGGIFAFITSPLQILKTRQQVAGWPLRKALLHSFTSTTSNAKSSWSSSRARMKSMTHVGFVPHFFCETVGRAVYFGTYEFGKNCLMEWKQCNSNTNDNDHSSYQLTIPERMLAASVSGISCWAVIYPFDVIRCRIHADDVLRTLLIRSSASVKLPSQRIDNFRRAVKIIYGDGKLGLKPFFRGLPVTVLRAGPVAAAVLPAYDLASEYFEKW